MKNWKIKVLFIVLLIIAVALVGCNTNKDLEPTTPPPSDESGSGPATPGDDTTTPGDDTTTPGDDDTGNDKPGEDEPGNDLDIDLEQLQEQYGEFSITATKGEEGVWSEDNKTYTISVSSAKSAYTITGYFEGQIIIDNPSDLSSFKGVELTLNNACLVTYTGSNIDYRASDKNVEIVAKKNTENYIINLGEGYYDCAVSSEKNIEVDGKGTLNIITKTGHGLRAESKIRVYDAPTINITSGHDAIHASKFVSNNEETVEADFEAFTGTINVIFAVSQAFDCTTGAGKGSIDLSSGTYIISNCESAFKTDTSLVIGGNVAATNLTADPVVKGAESSGVTIEILDGGVFTVDGNAYTKALV